MAPLDGKSLWKQGLVRCVVIVYVGFCWAVTAYVLLGMLAEGANGSGYHPVLNTVYMLLISRA